MSGFEPMHRFRCPDCGYYAREKIAFCPECHKREVCEDCGWSCPPGQYFRATDGRVCPPCLKKRALASKDPWYQSATFLSEEEIAAAYARDVANVMTRAAEREFASPSQPYRPSERPIVWPVGAQIPIKR